MSLQTDCGNWYETHVFDDDLPGAHNSLTQSEQLVDYAGYEQVIVGAAGRIALDQLADVNDKAVAGGTGRQVKVAIFKAPINHELDQKFADQLATADSPTASDKIQAKIDQRQSLPFGALFDEAGELAIRTEDYPGLNLAIVPVF